MKHKRKKIAVLLSLFILFTFIFMLGSIPIFEINKLQNQFVDFKVNKKGIVEYHIVKKKPKSWVQLKDISKPAVQAIMLSEDWFFYGHHGVDLSQLKEAAIDSMNGKKLRGASTISQQVTKNIFFTHDRTIKRKLKELASTIYLENKVSKDKILEIYLNIIQYGKNLYGIRKASKYYFKKSPKKLNAKEGAFLAMLLPSPVRYAQSFKERKLTDFAKTTVHNILDKMVLAKVMTAKEAAREKKRKLSFEKTRRSLKGHGNMQRIKKLSDGRDWEERYKYDPDLSLAEDVEYDPDAINDDDLNIKEEFAVD
ncbi:hypothetical protein A9Q84_06135 [Halobacteriovorax marinus]|uniref:Glycosyl transferase family 51 domain-containing protein n=1 Tax=Halobacteriovorax marinus TaxID=97084 RepID=A0A1Y5F9P7_9BACT|nr:hypothetical protein A9Q84_06135 [Halobacteriovorax marinus]